MSESEMNKLDVPIRLRKSPETRQKEMIAIAVSVSRKVGVTNLSFTALTKESNVSRSLWYYYFPTKNELIQKVKQELNK